MRDHLQLGAIEGDIASSIDADRVTRMNIPALASRAARFTPYRPQLHRAMWLVNIQRPNIVVIPRPK